MGEPVAHFGLGSATAVLSVTITWVDGTRACLGPLEIDRMHIVDPIAGDYSKSGGAPDCGPAKATKKDAKPAGVTAMEEIPRSDPPKDDVPLPSIVEDDGQGGADMLS